MGAGCEGCWPCGRPVCRREETLTCKTDGKLAHSYSEWYIEAEGVGILGNPRWWHRQWQPLLSPPASPPPSCFSSQCPLPLLPPKTNRGPGKPDPPLLHSPRRLRVLQMSETRMESNKNTWAARC